GKTGITYQAYSDAMALQQLEFQQQQTIHDLETHTGVIKEQSNLRIYELQIVFTTLQIDSSKRQKEGYIDAYAKMKSLINEFRGVSNINLRTSENSPWRNLNICVDLDNGII